ncbi:murein L,D-transpeptidase [Roseiarcaceae bacterium H3SJ34-1]|uniref:L,D-transpeptidase family protein n=1 Tax=Terripilifer ovatus TaxID=3032367 RepID=UPI003AB92729|nr:murein L,D-transpeptidase [Roseiarcaceae bacterium H3SJ34-1]
MNFTRFGSHLRAGLNVRIAVAMIAAGLLSACNDSDGLRSARAYQPIPADMLALMQEKHTTKGAPILIRTFKKEAELEIWKMTADGSYTHLKTYPMCRWSGQLGPKTREGDRQVPEGFYTITPGQMNPNSNYYLSFNVGYPNAYDKAHGYTGGMIMVHGDCSSAGCYSMTDQQIAEIYAIAREAFSGGQQQIQMQSMPFRMTPENLAKHRLDPNMPFWKEIKTGSDSFEVTRREPKVAVCGRRYVFNATANGGRFDATAACPPMSEDAETKALVSQRQKDEDAKVAELVASGVKPVKVVYSDGGQNPMFANVTRTSRPEALAAAPVEIAMEEKVKPGSRAAGKAGKTTAVANLSAPATFRPAQTDIAKSSVAAAVPPATAFAPTASIPAETEQPFYRRFLGSAETPKSEPAPAAIQPVMGEPASQAKPAAAATKPAAKPAATSARAPASAQQKKAQEQKLLDPRQKTSSLPQVVR